MDNNIEVLKEYNRKLNLRKSVLNSVLVYLFLLCFGVLMCFDIFGVRLIMFGICFSIIMWFVFYHIIKIAFKMNTIKIEYKDLDGLYLIKNCGFYNHQIILGNHIYDVGVSKWKHEREKQIIDGIFDSNELENDIIELKNKIENGIIK